MSEAMGVTIWPLLAGGRQHEHQRTMLAATAARERAQAEMLVLRARVAALQDAEDTEAYQKAVAALALQVETLRLAEMEDMP